MILYQCDICKRTTPDARNIHKFEYTPGTNDEIAYYEPPRGDGDMAGTMHRIPRFTMYTCRKCAVEILMPIYGDEWKKALDTEE